MKNNFNVGDSGMSKSSELISKVLKYLKILVSTGLLWGRNMPAINGLLGSTGLGTYLPLMVTAKLNMLLYQSFAMNTGMPQVVISDR